MSQPHQQNQNKLYLFYPVSIIGFIISLVTRSPFSHAAIEYNGVLYDSSESRGSFGVSDFDPSKRPHVVFRFYGNLQPWLDHMTGRKYDWKGVLLWVIKRNHRDKFYCFEAAWAALKVAGVVEGDQPKRLSGSDLMLVMNKHFSRSDPFLEIGLAAQIVKAIGGTSSEQYLQAKPPRECIKVARRINRAAERALSVDAASALSRMHESKGCKLAVEERLSKEKISIRA